MNDLRHTVEDAVSLPSPHVHDDGEAAEGPTGPAFDVEALEYYQRLHARHTLWARVALLVVIVGMLGANMWLTQRNYHTVIVNMDQSRLAQSELIDRHLAEADKQANRVAQMEAQLRDIRAAQEDASAEAVAVAD